GLQTSNSWTRENSSNDFLYNGGSELNGTTTWYETFFRGYDPVLGRFNQIDPMAHASSSFTPYNYAFNDPVFFNDPNGDYPPGTIEKMWGGGHGLYGNGWGGAIGVGSRSYVSDWGAEFRSIDMNAILMSRREFNLYYGITDKYGRVDTQRRDEIAAAAQYTWCSTCEVAVSGGVEVIDGVYHSYTIVYTGAWVPAQQGDPQTWYFMSRDPGSPHGLAYDPNTGMIYEVNHPSRGHGLLLWLEGILLNSVPNNGNTFSETKSVPYQWNMTDEKQRADFWGREGSS